MVLLTCFICARSGGSQREGSPWERQTRGRQRRGWSPWTPPGQFFSPSEGSPRCSVPKACTCRTKAHEHRRNCCGLYTCDIWFPIRSWNPPRAASSLLDLRKEIARKHTHISLTDTLTASLTVLLTVTLSSTLTGTINRYAGSYTDRETPLAGITTVIQIYHIERYTDCLLAVIPTVTPTGSLAVAVAVPSTDALVATLVVDFIVSSTLPVNNIFFDEVKYILATLLTVFLTVDRLVY